MTPDSAPDGPPTAVAKAEFDVPAQVVWAYRLDFANLPAYNPDVSDVTRVHDGDASGGGGGGVRGPGARYRFTLADPRQPGAGQPVELWTVKAEEPHPHRGGDGGRQRGLRGVRRRAAR